MVGINCTKYGSTLLQCDRLIEYSFTRSDPLVVGMPKREPYFLAVRETAIKLRSKQHTVAVI